MKNTSGLVLATLAASVSAAPFNHWTGGNPSSDAPVTASNVVVAPNAVARAASSTPTVYMCGDSTMALGGGGTGTQGTYHSLNTYLYRIANHP